MLSVAILFLSRSIPPIFSVVPVLQTLGLLLLLSSYITGFLLLMASFFRSLRGIDNLWVLLST